MYIHLHGHSHYGLLESIGKVAKILDKAKELGFSTMGLADYNGMYGIMEFYTKAKKADIKPLCGVQLTLTNVLGKIPSQDQYLTLLAKNYEGYLHLMKLTTMANTLGNNGLATIDIASVKEHSEGIICILGGQRSLLATQLADLKTANNFDGLIEEHIKPFQDIFGEDLYLEITAQDYRLEPALELLNEQIMKISLQTQIPCILNSNFHYINKEDKIAYETTLAIKDQKQIGDTSRRRVAGDYYIMSDTEVRDIMKGNGFDDQTIDKLCENNQKLADSINLILPKPTSPIFPLYKTPEQYVELYAKVKDSLIQK